MEGRPRRCPASERRCSSPPGTRRPLLWAAPCRSTRRSVRGRQWRRNDRTCVQVTWVRGGRRQPCHAERMSAGLTRTYEESRRRFLDAAATVGAETDSFVHPSRGLDDEELAIEVASFGPDDASSVLLIVSGTHGVEGFTGSALQHRWLDQHASRCPDGVRVVLVHALNPYGFSWVRRVNEDNVDLNRNFVDWSQPPPVNEAYSDVADLLVPQRWSAHTQQTTTLQLLGVAEEVGFDRLQEIVSGGQYTHPTGVFYGGTGPVWSHRRLEEEVGGLVGAATRLGIVDLHTGLGPWGHGELISHEAGDADGYRRSAAWWGDVRSMLDGQSVSANLSGDWLGRIEHLIPGVEVTAAALEFGTVDTVTVLQALRADAVLHAHGDPAAPEAADVRRQIRAAFADDDPAWFAAVAARFDDVVARALRELSANAGSSRT